MMNMRSRGVSSLIAAFGACGVALAPRQARACSISLPVPVATDPARVGTDHAPPQILEATIADGQRGDEGSFDGCVDTFFLDVVAEDDQSPPEKLRYRLQEWGEGEWYWLYEAPVPYLHLVWNQASEFRFRVVALDEAGNESAPFDFTYSERGDDAGCGLARRSRAAPFAWELLLVGLAAGVRRRRR
jgi:hypothetical protein